MFIYLKDKPQCYLIIVLLIFAGCKSSGSGSDEEKKLQLPTITVATNSYSFPEGEAITAITPVLSANVVSVSISPDINTNLGLSFNSTTGVISGTPNVGQASTNYILTALTALGASSSVVISFTSISYCNGAIVVGDFQAGDGTGPTPYEICNLDQLNHFVSYCDANALDDCLGLNFILGADIDLTAETFNPLDAFRGTFNGHNKTISNWTYNAADSADNAATIQANPAHVDYYLGFFRTLGDGALVKNLNLSAAAIKGRYYTGGLVGRMAASSALENSHVTTNGTDINGISGIIIGFNDIPTAGGATGRTAGVVAEIALGATVTGVSFAGMVRGAMHVGGVVGNCEGVVTESHSSGTMKGRDGNSGGFAGNISGVGSIISKSYTTSTVIDVLGNSGGFIGSVNAGALVTQSYSHGSINGGGYGIGGFVGYVIGAGAKITRSYSDGSVVGGSWVGGFVGWMKDGGVIEDSYSLSTVSSTTWAGGFAGVLSYPNNSAATLIRVYAAGSATSAGIYAADLVGYSANGGVVQDSFADENVSAAYGLVNTPNASTITNSLSLSTINMKLSSTYTDALWNFDTVWKRSDALNNGYPELQ